MQIPQEAVARFNSKFSRSSKGCHLWKDSLDKDGYGSFFLMGANRRAHRVSWLLFHGPIPAGMLVGHMCRNRACVNPQHLKLVTPKENSLKNSDSIPAINAQKTHCKNGHILNKTYRSKRGLVRYCSVCATDKKRRLRAAFKDPLKGIV